MNYSTPQEIEEFIRNLGPNPTAVCDLDGNLFVGYKLTEGNEGYFEGHEGIENPFNQTIPFGLSLAELEQLVEKGVLEKDIFAAKTMDVRLPLAMVDALNDLEKSGKVFKFTFLTSREMNETIKIFKESGVKNPENLVIAADSGANIYVKGKYTEIRALNEEELSFLDRIKELSTDTSILNAVANAISQAGHDPSTMPGLYYEKKAIAANIHYRAILEHYKEAEGSDLDKAINGILSTAIDGLIPEGPQYSGHAKFGDGEFVFKRLVAPATTEVKIKDIDKGDGLQTIATAARNQDGPLIPSDFIFTGDDVGKKEEDGSIKTGTDYYAMVKGVELENDFGIPFYNMHTNHPKEEGTLDAKKHVSILGEDAPAIAVTVKDPAQNVAVILNALGLGQFLPKIDAGMVYGPPNGPYMPA